MAEWRGRADRRPAGEPVRRHQHQSRCRIRVLRLQRVVRRTGRSGRLHETTRRLDHAYAGAALQRQDGAQTGAVLTDRARRPGQSRFAGREGEQPAAGALHARDGGRRQDAQGHVRRPFCGEHAAVCVEQGAADDAGRALECGRRSADCRSHRSRAVRCPAEACGAAPHAVAAGGRRQEPALVSPVSGDGRIFDLR